MATEALYTGTSRVLCTDCAIQISELHKHSSLGFSPLPSVPTARSASAGSIFGFVRFANLVDSCLGSTSNPAEGLEFDADQGLQFQVSPWIAGIDVVNVSRCAVGEATESGDKPFDDWLLGSTEHALRRLGFLTRQESEATKAVDNGEDLPTRASRKEDSAQGSSNYDKLTGRPHALCFACTGLLQYKHALIVPRAVQTVRCSPFLDANQLQLSINVPRGLTFIWLAAAIHVTNAVLANESAFAAAGETEEARTAARNAFAFHTHVNNIAPEAWANFKDWYSSTLRQDILQLLEDTQFPAALAPQQQRVESMISALVGGPSQLEAAVTCRSAFTYATEGLHLAIDFGHNSSEGITAKLPKGMQSNKSTSVVPFKLVREVVPAETLFQHAGTPGKLRMKLTHENLYIIGNYCKYHRSVSQSPWFAKGERIGNASLQEILAESIVPLFFPNGVPNTAAMALEQQLKEEREFEETQQAANGDGDVGSKRKRGLRLMGGMASPQHEDTLDAVGARVFGWGSYKFHSAGREDVDVRMLGTGRPFVLEIINPHRVNVSAEELKKAADAVNESHNGVAEVMGSLLRYVDAGVVARLGTHSESKKKFYRCVVYCSRAIKSNNDEKLLALKDISDLTISQRTPLRVLHRRSLLARDRTIHRVSAERINDHWLVVDVETQAGTYVKEFVHGDLGRTVPNLGMLLDGVTDIVQLDVLGMVYGSAEEGEDAADPSAALLAPTPAPES